jgi:DNA mismatch endonuclease (patch repair protein)
MTWPKANHQWWVAKIESNKRRDAETNSRLRMNGWRVLRIWEHEDPGKASARVAAIVRATMFKSSVGA